MMDDVYGNSRSPVYEEPPPYSPIRRNGTNDFFLEKSAAETVEKGDGIVVRIVRTLTRTTTINMTPKNIARSTSDFFQTRTWPAIQNTAAHVTPVVSTTSQATWDFILKRVWPAIKTYPLYWSQLWAFLLLSLGIAPFVTYGIFMAPWEGPFYYNAFATKTLGCGQSFGQPQNMTVEGVEALFVLDWTFGQLSFARVKAVNIAWEMLVGRGVQGIYWAICYRVFTDALLRLIERHPASYETFRSISLEGPGVGSSLMLVKQLFRNRSIRTWFLFFYLLLSSIFVLGIPPLLSAVAGYDSTQIAWVSIGSPDNIIPSSQVQTTWVLTGTYTKNFDEPLCNPIPELGDWYYHQRDIDKYCDCQLPNKTTLNYNDWQYYINSLSYYSSPSHEANDYSLGDCNVRFPGNDKRYQSTWGQYANYERAANWGEFSCNDTFEVTLPNNEKYSMWDLKFDMGFCFQNKSYDTGALSESTRCLPDTANPSYAWGFSSTMLGVIFILNITWCLSMWAVWQDALCAKLVRDGYRMSPLRAAFVLTEAAMRRTGLKGEGLILRDRKLLRRELRRGRGKREAMVEVEVFQERPGGEDGEEGKGGVVIRRKPVGGWGKEGNDYGGDV